MQPIHLLNYRFRNKVNVADSDAQNLMGDNWANIKDKIDNATNEHPYTTRMALPTWRLRLKTEC